MKYTEEMIDVNLYLDKATADKINKMTKAEMRGIIAALTLRGKVQDETVEKLEREKTILDAKLDKAESYVEQGRVMIEAIMDKWYGYES